jgi:predicted small integral membrane protein
VNVAAQGGLTPVTAVTALLLLLLIAAIFNRVHGQGVNQKGDRVFSGLLALPLITLWVKLVFPKASIWWALLAPVPLAVYVVLFSLTDVPPKPLFSWENLRKDGFTLALLVSFGIFYVVLAAYALTGLVVALALALALIGALVVLRRRIRRYLQSEESEQSHRSQDP